MKNTISVRVEFSYQGETHTPSATIDLDSMMEKGGDLADLHAFLAVQHGIDTYSYLYEVMEAHEPLFDEATGLARQCLKEGQFDMARFRELWRNEHELQLLADIAARHLDIDDLDNNPALKNALLEAYEAGRHGKLT